MPARSDGGRGVSTGNAAPKPWGAPVSFGRGAVKPAAHGTRVGVPKAKENDPYAHVMSRVSTSGYPAASATFVSPAGSAMKQQRKHNKSKPLAPTPRTAPGTGTCPPPPSDGTMSRSVPGAACDASRQIREDTEALPLALSNDWPSAVQSMNTSLSTSTALRLGCTLHDLTPEDKRKVAKLIKQVVEYAEGKKKLELEIEEMNSKLSACEQSRDAARKSESTRKQELAMLTKKLDSTLAAMEGYKRKDVGKGNTTTRVDDDDRLDKISFGNEKKENGYHDDALWRQIGAASPMTRAVVDEVRAVLAGEMNTASMGNQSGKHQSPQERQRPPLAVGPTEVFVPPKRSPAKARRMRAAAEAAAATSFRGFSPTDCPYTSTPLTPELPEEVRAAAHCAAHAESSCSMGNQSEPSLAAALKAGVAVAARAGVCGKDAAFLKNASGEGWHLPASPTSNDPRVLRFDPNRGVAGAFYFGYGSEDAPDSDSGSAGDVFGEDSAFQRSVRAALGVAEVSVGTGNVGSRGNGGSYGQTHRHVSGPNPVTYCAAADALVGLDDDMQNYRRKVIDAKVQQKTSWWETDRAAPEVSFVNAVPTVSPGGSSDTWVLRSGDGASGKSDGTSSSQTRNEPSLFGPVSFGPRLATIATRIARDDPHAQVTNERAGRVQRGVDDRKNFAAPPSSPTVTPQTKRLTRRVFSPMVTTRRMDGPFGAEPFGSPSVSRSRTGNSGTSKPIGRNPDPYAMAAAHAAVRVAAAAVDAALFGTGVGGCGDETETRSVETEYADAIPSVVEPVHDEPCVATAVESIDDDPTPEAHATREEACPSPATSPDTETRDNEQRVANPAASPAAYRTPQPPGSDTPVTCSSVETPASTGPQSDRKHRKRVDLDVDLIDLVDEVDEISLAQPRHSRPAESSYDTHVDVDRFGRTGRPTNPRLVAQAAQRRVQSRSKSKCPERSRRKKLAANLESLRLERVNSLTKTELNWRTDYRSFSESKTGEALM